MGNMGAPLARPGANDNLELGVGELDVDAEYAQGVDLDGAGNGTDDMEASRNPVFLHFMG